MCVWQVIVHAVVKLSERLTDQLFWLTDDNWVSTAAWAEIFHLDFFCVKGHSHPSEEAVWEMRRW